MFGQECWYFLKSFHKCTLFYKKNKTNYLLYTIKKRENIISKIVFYCCFRNSFQGAIY